MEPTLKRIILRDRQIQKFSLYGFLKNLKFFEPYLLIYLLGHGLTLLQIGLLFSIREVVVNVLEIPSGIAADTFGRKKSLCLCFVCYILSFVLFFFTRSFATAAVAMVSFGCGEAFRSGTHKAMIYSYLELQGWACHKAFVYGKTRSSSLLGSAVSAVLSVLIILHIPNSGYIFLASTLPYLLDFLLILTYPASIDRADASARRDAGVSVWQSVKIGLLQRRELRHILCGNGVFEAVVTSVKDFIQPILETIILGSGLVLLTGFSAEDNLKLVLGLLYGLINLCSAAAARNAYHLKKSGTSPLNTLYLGLGAVFCLLGLLAKQPLAVGALFLCISLLQNLRKPLFVDVIGDQMGKMERATILSIASQLKSVLVIFLAPLAGFVADRFGMAAVMFALSGLLFLLYPLSRLSTHISKEE